MSGDAVVAYALAAHDAALARLELLEDLLDRENDGEAVDWPVDLQAPYCGCVVCQVRETLQAAWPHLTAAAWAEGPPDPPRTVQAGTRLH